MSNVETRTPGEGAEAEAPSPENESFKAHMEAEDKILGFKTPEDVDNYESERKGKLAKCALINARKFKLVPEDKLEGGDDDRDWAADFTCTTAQGMDIPKINESLKGETVDTIVEAYGGIACVDVEKVIKALRGKDVPLTGESAVYVALYLKKQQIGAFSKLAQERLAERKDVGDIASI